MQHVPLYVPQREPDGERWLLRWPDSETREAARDRAAAEARVTQALVRERRARDLAAVAALRGDHPCVSRDRLGLYLEVPLEEYKGGGYERLILRLPEGPLTRSELGKVIRIWLALLSAESGPPEWADPCERDRAVSHRRIVAERYAFELLRLQRSLETTAGFAKVLFGGKRRWSDIDRVPPEALIGYLATAVHYEATTARDPRVRTLALGGRRCRELDAPLRSDPTRTKAEVLLRLASREAAEREQAVVLYRRRLREFALRTTSKSLQRMALLLAEYRNKDAAIAAYGVGGLPAFKRLRAELRHPGSKIF